MIETGLPSGLLSRNLAAAFTIWQRDLPRFLRNRAWIIASLGQPLLFLFVFGGGLAPAMSGLGGGTVDFRQFLFPGILAMTVLFTSVFSAASIVWDREFGFLKEVLVAPVSRTAVALGKVAGGSSVAMLQGLLILLLAPLLDISLSIGQIASLLGIMLLLAATMSALGILLAARQRSMEGFQMIMQFLLLPMFFLSGAFFPLQDVPIWMDALARIDPGRYGVDPIRAVALQGSIPDQALNALTLYPIQTNLIVLMGLTILFLAPAIWLFNKQD